MPPHTHFITILALLLTATACGKEDVPASEPIAPEPVVIEPTPDNPIVDASASFAAVGDLLMHANVKRSARESNRKDEAGVSTNNDGFNALFEYIAPLIQPVDYAFANLETPVAPTHGKGAKSMVFNVSPALLPALVHSGFDIVSFANNHSYDQGINGMVETIDRLDASPLAHIGTGKDCAQAAKPVLVDIQGIQVGFIGTTMLFNDQLNRGPNLPCVFDYERGQALESVRIARQQGAEFVVLSIHWGSEYRSVPTSGQRKIAAELIEGGVDLLLGHHAHVLMPVETHTAADGRRGIIAYGLGNHISNQSRKYVFGVSDDEMGNTRDGIILMLDFVRKNYGKDETGKQVFKTEMANLRAVPTWTTNNYPEFRRGKAPHIRVHPTYALLQQAEATPTATMDEATLAAHNTQIALYKKRLVQVGDIVGHELLSKELASPKEATLPSQKLKTPDAQN